MRIPRITWRRSAAFALLLVLIVPALAACGGGGAAPAAATSPPAAAAATSPPAAAAATAAPAAAATEAPKPTEAAPAAATEAPKPTEAAPAAGRGAGGTLRILYWQAPTILNSQLAQGTKDFDAARLILEPLAAVAPDGNPVPVLAAEVPTVDNGGVSKDLKTVTWKLKPGIKWSDGSDLTADDVVFTWQYCADEKTACTTSTSFAGAEKVEAVDAATVKITWKEPNPNPYQMFVTGLGNILQKKQFANCIGEKASTDSACQQANNAPIGTGPYKLKEFKPGDVVTYEINENYRDPNKPFFKDVEFKGGGDATSAARAVFETGDADYGWNLQVEAAVLKQLLEGGKGELVTVPSPNVERLLLNRTNPDPALGDKRSEPNQPHPFLTDLKVRQALAMAIDRKAMAEQLYGPAGDPTCNIVVTAPFVAPDQVYVRNKCDPDVEGAKKLLDEAGWKVGADGSTREKDGKPLVVTYQTTINTLRQKEQALVKANWSAIGVTVQLRAIDAGVFFSSDKGNPDTAAHFYTDVEMFTNGAEQPDQTNYLCGWATDQIAQKSNGWNGNNYERYSNPDFDKLCQQLRVEPDPAKRNDITLKMNDILVQDVVIIPLIARKNVSGYSKQLKGINVTGWDSEMWNIADWTMGS